MIDDAHYIPPFGDDRDGEGIFPLLSNEFDRAMSSPVEFGSSPGYAYAGRPIPMSETKPTPLAMSRAMSRAMPRIVPRGM